MPQEKEVISDSSTEEKETQVVDSEVPVTPVQENEDQQTEQDSPEPDPGSQPGKKTDVEDLDERGVPWKNRALEYERKLRETSESLPKLIEKSIAENLGKQQPQEKEMTFEQLEAFAIEKPEYRAWVEGEKEKLREKKAERRLADAMKRTETAKETEFKKKQSLDYVAQNYSEMFSKDKQGRIMDWDHNHPMTQEVSRIMQDPRFSSDPEGLVAATEIAYARFARNQVSQKTNEVKKVTAKLKKAENQTFVEGSGKTPLKTSGDPVKKAIEQLSKTGSKADADAAVKAYFKKSGRI